MLSVILKALELLIDVIKGIKSPEKQRAKLGKQLAKIFLDLDEVVRAGEDILTLLDQKSGMSAHHLLDKLTTKQKAIEKVMTDFNDETIKSIIRIHLPEFRGLHGMLHAKHAGIVFLLSQLIISEEKSKLAPRADTEDSFEAYREQKRKLENLAKSYPDFRDYFYYPGLNLAKLAKDWGIQEYGDSDLSYIIATKEQINSFKRITKKIKQLNETLRQLLAEKFKIEELS